MDGKLNKDKAGASKDGPGSAVARQEDFYFQMIKISRSQRRMASIQIRWGSSSSVGANVSVRSDLHYRPKTAGVVVMGVLLLLRMW